MSYSVGRRPYKAKARIVLLRSHDRDFGRPKVLMALEELMIDSKSLVQPVSRRLRSHDGRGRSTSVRSFHPSDFRLWCIAVCMKYKILLLAWNASWSLRATILLYPGRIIAGAGFHCRARALCFIWTHHFAGREKCTPMM